MLTRSSATRQGKGDEVARRAAEALVAQQRRRVRVRRGLPSPSPPRGLPSPPRGLPSPSPPPEIRNLRVTPGAVHVIAYEGATTLQLDRFVPRFVDLCYTPGYGQGIQRGYVKSKFSAGKNGLSNPSAVFTLVAVKNVDGRNLVVGYAQCTVYSALRGVASPRVVKLDLICTQGKNPADRLKGAASVLMDELQRYAAQRLGANVLVLDSVDNPNTWQFYQKLGFSRAADQCTGAGERGSYGNAARRFQAFPEYVAAMQGVYLPGLNVVLDGGRPDTVFMSKCLRSGSSGVAPGVTYPPAAAGATTYATLQPATRLLAVYAPGKPLARSGVPLGAVPDLLGPSTPTRRETRVRRRSESPEPVAPGALSPRRSRRLR